MSGSTTRKTLTEQVSELREVVTDLATVVTALASGQFATPATVVSEITDAPSVRPAPANVKVVSIKTAEKRVAEGESAWDIHVRSSEGNVIPFGVIVRAQKAAARKAAKANGTHVPAKKATKPNKFFAMSGADLRADGSKGALAEIARREAKRASK